MWKTLQAAFATDRDLPARTARIQALQRVLSGTLYDGLKYAFHEETNGAGEYIKLRDRRPSVRKNLCKLVVQQSVGMLFSEGHFPGIRHKDEASRETLAAIIRSARLNAVMIDAATKGSVGSVCLWLRILKGRIFVQALTTEYLTPTWDPEQPDRLLQVRQRYKVKGSDLRAMGYAVANDDLDAQHWWTRDWTTAAEAWYLPVKVSEDDSAAPKLQMDDKRSVSHGLGFVPMVWIRNLQGGDDIDGLPTFDDEAIETNIELEYLLSQNGRGLKYAMDPLLLIKEPATDPSGQMVRSASNAIVVSKEGDAKLVEIDGTASAAVLEFAKELRDTILETLRGSRANPDKLAAAQSGRALQLLNQALVWLADELRISYGEDGLKRLLTMIAQASRQMQLIDSDGRPIPKVAEGPIALDWPDWYPATTDDRASEASTMRTLVDSGLMSRKTAIQTIAPSYDIEDVEAEAAAVQAELAERNAAAQQQVKIQE